MLYALAQTQEAFVLDVRHNLHAHPELRWQEDSTLETIATDVVESMKFFPRHTILEWKKGFTGGLVFDLTVDPELPRILFRADVDALPIHEATGLPFASQNPGVMHACGHDTHAAMLLGFLRAIASNSVQLTHNLRIVFQRAEENPGTDPNPESGGHALVREGVLEGISHAYALHIYPPGIAGVFCSRPGALLGNSGRLQMRIRATGGHVARPQDGSNALRITHAIQTALDSFAARHLPPYEPHTLEPAILKAGTGSNVMPSEAELWYGVRTMLPQAKHVEFMAAIEDEVRAIVARYPGASVEFNRILGHPSLLNDSTSVRDVTRLLTDGGLKAVETEPELGGEDFAHYLDLGEDGVPGSFWFLGAGQQGSGPLHSPTMNPDESILYKGVLFWLLLATQ